MIDGLLAAYTARSRSSARALARYVYSSWGAGLLRRAVGGRNSVARRVPIVELCDVAPSRELTNYRITSSLGPKMQRLSLVALAIGANLSLPALAADRDAQIVPLDQTARPLPLVLRGGGAEEQSGVSASGNIPTVTRGTQPNPGRFPPPRSSNQGSAGRASGPVNPDSGFNPEYDSSGLNYSR